ncbi:hypothetical protein [Mycolicibacterium neoaurum]|uniref:hypothetical protein n=1 Tax=Mycolicibacterium neoaurum TaxID=1795 RepID=UPI00114D4BA5|nr:hypothetical protein [Mycolicibacterium neoaurum]
MQLSEDEVQAALYCVAEAVHTRSRAGRPVPELLRRLSWKLNLTRALSSSGQENGSAGAGLNLDKLIGTREAAAILGTTPRTALRYAPDLGGQKRNGRMLYDRTTVEQYARDRRPK